MGPDAIAERKTEHGNPLPLLGLTVRLTLWNFECQPAPIKCEKWGKAILDALASRRLLPGEASKFAGRFGWASCNIFGRVGRGLLRPIHDQCRSKHARIGVQLRLSLEWWEEVLRTQVRALRPWAANHAHSVNLFADASGTPPYLGAVVIADGRVWFTHMEVPWSLLRNFLPREDAQILGLELPSIALGLCTFYWLLRRRNVRVWSDNTGSEGSLRKGAARQFDHSCLVRCMRLKAIELQANLRVDRVSTDDNVGDGPSRRDVALLRAMGAIEASRTCARVRHRTRPPSRVPCQVAPHLDDRFWEPAAWESLKLRFMQQRGCPKNRPSACEPGGGGHVRFV